MKNTYMQKENHMFRRLYYKGKCVKTPYFILYYLKRPKTQSVKQKDNTYKRIQIRNFDKYNTLGLTTGKKLGKAYVRNRVRRIMKESYRLLESEIKTGYDFVIVGRVNCIDKKSTLLYNVLKKSLAKEGLLTE